MDVVVDLTGIEGEPPRRDDVVTVDGALLRGTQPPHDAAFLAELLEGLQQMEAVTPPARADVPH